MVAEGRDLARQDESHLHLERNAAEDDKHTNKQDCLYFNMENGISGCMPGDGPYR